MTAAERPMDSVVLLIGVAVIMYGTYSAVAENRGISLAGPCSTPQGQPGTCTTIDFCDSLRLMIRQSPIPPKDLDYLRHSQCVIQRLRPYVCCPNSRGRPVPPIQGGALNGTGENLGSRDPESHPNFRLLSTDRCGAELNKKIVNGEIANLGQYPWVAAMEYQTKAGLKVWCGGTLISDRYIVTAAHCVKRIGNNRLVAVRLGEHNLLTDPDCVPSDSGQICADRMQSFKPAEIVAHPEYIAGSTEQYNDIALIRLGRKVTFTNYIVPICLPSGKTLTKKYDGSKMIVAGWGATEDGTHSNVKRWVRIPVVSTTECQFKFRNEHTLSESQMCAGGFDRKDSCRGDSGGPLMTIESVVRNRPGGQWALAGVVSIGPGICGLMGNPGIYTRVGPYVNWILDNLKP